MRGGGCDVAAADCGNHICTGMRGMSPRPSCDCAYSTPGPTGFPCICSPFSALFSSSVTWTPTSWLPLRAT
eukprot:2476118-Prorocentrum_lima.AAC.1